MQAIILAGGFGTRLLPAVQGVPKPMADVAGRPFLCWLLDYMAGQGVREAVLCVHHMHDTIRAYFGACYAGITLSYSIEESPLGTGGAMKRALAQLNPAQPVFVLNGDSYIPLDYRRMMTQHRNSGRSLTMAARRVSDCSRYSKLTIEGDIVSDFALLGDAQPGTISAGFYVMSPTFFKGMALPETFSFERDVMARRASALRPGVYTQLDYFIDIGVPADYRRAQHEIPASVLMPKVA